MYRVDETPETAKKATSEEPLALETFRCAWQRKKMRWPSECLIQNTDSATLKAVLRNAIRATCMSKFHLPTTLVITGASLWPPIGDIRAKMLPEMKEKCQCLQSLVCRKDRAKCAENSSKPHKIQGRPSKLVTSVSHWAFFLKCTSCGPLAVTHKSGSIFLHTPSEPQPRNA